MNDILSLTPKGVWKNFYELSQVPRPSGHMGPVTEFLVNFGKKLNLETFVDEIGNVIIRKPATKGYENKKGVILQAHMDMVPQKNNDTVHDFTKDPIQVYVDGEWVKAKGTTLGADNGLGVAAIMTVLEDDTLKHGPIEALITKDEETGMYGAFGLKKEDIKGEILLNLDSEDEGELYIGCAGGVDINVEFKYRNEPVKAGHTALRVDLKGLRGGHSGLEINQGRANANKLMFRFLHKASEKFGARISEMEGGNMRNAIPREAYAIITLPTDKEQEAIKLVAECEALFRSEYDTIEDAISFKAAKAEMPQYEMQKDAQDRFVNAILACQNGVMRNIPTIPDTVETSSNMSIVKISNETAEVKLLTRGSCDSMKFFLAESIKSAFTLAGAEVTFSGAYSGWQPNVNSPIMLAMKEAYEKQFGTDPAVKVVHAGLECGIIGANIPGLDMVSFGPTLRSPHSPDERAYIPSVKKFYEFLVATLENIPEKK